MAQWQILGIFFLKPKFLLSYVFGEDLRKKEKGKKERKTLLYFQVWANLVLHQARLLGHPQRSRILPGKKTMSHRSR